MIFKAGKARRHGGSGVSTTRGPDGKKNMAGFLKE
jgi:hypothetical protein